MLRHDPVLQQDSWCLVKLTQHGSSESTCSMGQREVSRLTLQCPPSHSMMRSQGSQRADVPAFQRFELL